MAGGAADCSFWIRKLQAEALFHEQTEGGRRMSVARASRLLANALYSNRGLGLSVGTMICGYDDTGNSSRNAALPKIYYVDNTGMRIESDLFAVGSGSTYALGILDSERARRFEMTADEAVALGIRAIRHATYRDAYSGGFINVYLITPEHGWRQVYSEDLASLQQREGPIM
jgi:20S proteasome subunit beta 5